jgi:hypothetical protein
VYETVSMHHRNGAFDRKSISEHAPDLVIYEITERGLGWSLRPIRR